MKNLIVYFSHTGENYFKNGLKDLKVGNAKIIADYVKEIVGGDELEIIPGKVYPYGYYDCCDVAKTEKLNNEKIDIVDNINSIDDYKDIFLVYPIWWDTCPMAVFTFLRKFDFENKHIIPFATNEGSGVGESIKDIKNLTKSSFVESGISIFGYKAKDSKEDIKNYIKNLKY
jgi:flavodoxin